MNKHTIFAVQLEYNPNAEVMLLQNKNNEEAARKEAAAL